MSTHLFGVDIAVTSSSAAQNLTRIFNKADYSSLGSTISAVHLVQAGDVLTLMESRGRPTTAGVLSIGYFGVYVTDVTGTTEGALVASAIEVPTTAPHSGTVGWHTSAPLVISLASYVGQYIKLAVGHDSYVANPWRCGQIAGVSGDMVTSATNFPNPFGASSNQSSVFAIRATVTRPDPYSITSVNGDNELNSGAVNTAVVAGYVAGVNPVTSGTVGALAVASVSQASTTATFTIPAPVNNTAWPEPDTTQTLTLADAAAHSATFDAPFNSLENYTSIPLVDPDISDPKKLGYWLNIPPVDDDRIMSKPADMVVAADTSVTDAIISPPTTSIFYHWVSATGFIYEYEVLLSGGEIVQVVGVTLSAFSASSFTASAIVAVAI
jgi:hypothetical protein